jgi:hypothetical protein
VQAFPISKPGCTIFHFKLADSFTREEDKNTVVDCAFFVCESPLCSRISMDALAI